jgi:hypothetical protein
MRQVHSVPLCTSPPVEASSFDPQRVATGYSKQYLTAPPFRRDSTRKADRQAQRSLDNFEIDTGT